MGWKLAEEVQRYAPASLTWRELYVLVVLAHDARDGTRKILGGIEGRPDIIKRIRASPRQRAEVIASLIAKGALTRIERGRRGTHAVFEIPRFTQGAETTHPNGNSMRKQLQQHAETAATACGNSGVRVRERRAPSRHPVSPGDVPSRPRERRPVAAADVIEAVREEMKNVTGREITKEEAHGIGKYLLDGREVKNAAAYCRQAIRNETNPVERFLPHNPPPPLSKPPNEPADPAFVRTTAGEVRQQLQQRQPDPAYAEVETAAEQET
jgi:hypothetical protein